MSKPIRITFAYFRPPESMPSYVARDMAILGEIAETEWVPSYPGPAWRARRGPAGWLPSRQMQRTIDRNDLVFQWFATPSAPVVGARLSRKPSIVVAGGFDVAAVPDIGYGRMLHPLTRGMAKLALRGANDVLAVSAFNAGEVSRWAPRANLQVLPHGFDPKPPPRTSRIPRVVTVGAISKEYMLRKGLEDFAKTSRALPDVEFVLAGKHVQEDAVEHLRGIGGTNLSLPGFLPDERLEELMGTSALYLQLSRHEAFGCSVAEAMLAGCTPVLTRDGALPEVAGEVAHYVDSRDPETVAGKLRSALDDLRPQSSYERITSRYPIEARRQRLHELVRSRVPTAGERP